MTTSEIHSVIQRYLGRMVTIQTYGNQRLFGRVAQVGGECVLLTNAITMDEHDGSRWQDEILSSQLEDGIDSGVQEVFVHLHHILSVCCDDAALPEVSLQPDNSPFADMVDSGVDSVESDSASSDPIVGITDRLEVKLGASILAVLQSDGLDYFRSRVAQLRSELFEPLGFSFPDVRVSSRSEVAGNEYQIHINSREAGRFELREEKVLVLHPDSPLPTEWNGEEIQEPAFGLTASWIDAEFRKPATEQGYCTVDAVSVLITHLGELIKMRRAELLSYQAVTESVDQLREQAPALVNDHFSTEKGKLLLFRVLRSLVQDRVWIGDLERIAEAVAVGSSEAESFETVLSQVRLQILDLILRPCGNGDETVDAIVVDGDFFVPGSHQAPSDLLVEMLDEIETLQAKRKNNFEAAIVLVIPENANRIFRETILNMDVGIVILSPWELSQLPNCEIRSTIRCEV